ncbi:hypothetical protein [Escherichia coli]|uniref:RipA family octameric membrane protein n=1 Tax=Escherichia coli TaxID=562 RepID=UPI000BE4C7E8|nr:hypothetical protein [Escherichia coli]EED1254396.1 hypothetical protein [Escherichia coli]EED1759100.1 hypothetical protein [Escherichia coli]EER1173011.1 hypothetical protein [Escherichia coli]EEV1742264.1 hypothetical protein [Escherichia coli]EEV3455915.1 hypothetical protein [Escherichia coli]
MNEEVTFAKTSKPKRSSDLYEDCFAQNYFKEPSINLYFKKLLGCKDKLYLTNGDLEKLKESYDKAHDIRKFEIELYWKRTTYIWTLVAALITTCAILATAYYRIHDSVSLKDGVLSDTKYFLLASLAGLSFFGVIITITSSFILKSGEYWQKNWEYHVSLLEPLFSGRLYSTLLDKNKNRYSIAGLNNVLYAFFLFLWSIMFIIITLILSTDFSAWYYFPLIIISCVIFAIKTISCITRRTANISQIKISQWGVEIEEKTSKEGNKISRLYYLLETILKVVKILIYCFLAVILGKVIFHHLI